MASRLSHPHPADFVVTANRLPVDITRTADGGITASPSPGGLVTALRPVLKTHHGHWVGWNGQIAGDPQDPPVALGPCDGLSVVQVQLDEDDYRLFYEGMSNATLWPLYHDRIVEPVYNPQWFSRYRKVNRRYAHHTAAVAAPGATVWVQDYQLQLVPGMLKKLRPDIRCGFFCHIPFPSPDLFSQLPWREEILSGLLQADLIGFHLVDCAKNFLATVQRTFPAARVAGTPSCFAATASVTGTDGHTSAVGAFPISIDTATVVEQAAATDPESLRRQLGDPRLVITGVDRMDYTKGILQRLQAFEQLLDSAELDPEHTVFVQVATPSRERLEHYRATRREVEQAVGRINGRFGTIGHPVVHYLHGTLPAEKLYQLYRATDVMVVNAFKDGMNLVAKEFVACHTDGSGALVLSEFTGAARELTQAHLINPHAPEDLPRAMAAAAAEMTAHPDAAAARMHAMAETVRNCDVTWWAQKFLSCLLSPKGTSL
ncbi:trehalose-6-phosphate synthase [Corynebacterium mendelii]|uniref:alpha,alpha-trehalose-phosphate synthase (ADP-forming) n=1 Tax=Corynebacterium mendelii TaxID=2765362 RepID=A0A939IYV6_9CORY|nr:trehalose-6-phosphate synthase [Corynebacterium mendelii]